jgi:hypothetical protein
MQYCRMHVETQCRSYLVRVAGRLVVVGVWDEARHHPQQRERFNL